MVFNFLENSNTFCASVDNHTAYLNYFYFILYKKKPDNVGKWKIILHLEPGMCVRMGSRTYYPTAGKAQWLPQTATTHVCILK